MPRAVKLRYLTIDRLAVVDGVGALWVPVRRRAWLGRNGLALVLCFAAAVAAFTAGLKAPASRISESPSPRAPVTAPSEIGSSTVPVAAQGQISAALGALDPTYAARTAGRQVAVTNRAQGLNARFLQGGVLVRSGQGRVGISLAGVASVAPRSQRNRVTYTYPGLKESFTNGPLGLEQSFAVGHAPAAGPGELTLALALSGNLRASLAGGGRSLLFSRSGIASLAYRGLTVTDAHGRQLHSWLELHGSRLLIRVDTRGAVYPIRIDPYLQEAKLTGETSAEAGSSLAVSGNTVVAGAPDATVGLMADAGAVLVFTKSPNGWSATPSVAVLTAAVPASGAKLGTSVAISDDGGTIVAGAIGGASGDGTVFVFTENGNAWTSENQVARLTDSGATLGEGLGDSVAISSNGSTVAAGAPLADGNDGAVLVFTEPGGGWAAETQAAKLTASDRAVGDALGATVALSQDGGTVVAGAPNATENSQSQQGAVYVYTESGSWSNATESAKLTLPIGTGADQLGRSVALSGSTIAAGAPGFSGTDSDQGAVFLFTEPGSAWTSETASTVLTASGPREDDALGTAVAISGTTVVAGTPMGGDRFQGVADVFYEPGSGWPATGTNAEQLSASDGASGDTFGHSVAISGTTIAVGAPMATANGNTDQGAAYVFVQQGSTSTSVNCSPNPVASGKATTCTVTVQDTSANPSQPGGTVSFSTTGSGQFSGGGGCSLTGILKTYASTCSLTYTESDDTSPTITAVYNGDATHPTSRSSTVLTVTQALDATSTAVNCSNGDPGVGTQTTCTATVTDSTNSSSTPTGSVTWSSTGAAGSFSDSATCTLSSGSCSVGFTPSASGETDVIASYGGDSSHAASSGSQALNGGLYTWLFQGSFCPTPVEVGQEVTCIADLMEPPLYSYTPTGTITWQSTGPATFSNYPANELDGSFTGNPCELSEYSNNYGAVACVEYYTPTAAGTQTITLNYSGDSSYAPSSTSFPVTVTPNPSSTSVTCSPNPASSNQQSTCTATVTDTGANPIMPGGTVSFGSSGSGSFSNGGSCSLQGNEAGSSCSVTYTQADAGFPSITATYNGDGAHTGSSGSTPMTVTANPTTTGVNCLPSSPKVTEQSSCTVTVTDVGTVTSTPTGTVAFTSSAPSGQFTDSGSCTLSSSGGDSATCSVSYSQATSGNPDIVATYSGDGSHSGSPGTETLTIKADSSSTRVACAPTPPAIGAQTKCTATVTDTAANPLTPTGSVSFTTSNAKGTFTSKSCSLSGSGASASCQVEYSQSEAGAASIVGTYGGDGAHTGSHGSRSVSVLRNPDSVTVSCSPNPLESAKHATCKAVVKDKGTNPIRPTGLISFTSSHGGTFDHSSCGLGGTGDATGSCEVTYTPSSDTSGSGSVITAHYPGDTNHPPGSGTVTVKRLPMK